ncbi:hypothetical protein PUMCH_001622 [Australozyma saopauloensis]|uniref:Transcriptional regulator n=1 Tax=Australozyma saopauloensis TaxID=291208 RepID=A0AAX4H7C3_9ASCO|nr:hypothetical protein PUMCH_001622 [[Candida] saopauloensis]
MYIPQKFNVDDWSAQEHLIKSYPLGTIVTIDENGAPIANHFPFFLHVDEQSGKKYLHAHVAKRNHQIPSLTANDNVLVIFQSPSTYILPSYYPEKARTHKFVPTWDFASLHITGKLRIIDDFDFVRAQLNHFTDQNEAEREDKWKVDDAPENYLKIMQKAITGLEIEIVDTKCKYKFEQKETRENVDGVIAGLASDGKEVLSEYVKNANEGL